MQSSLATTRSSGGAPSAGPHSNGYRKAVSPRDGDRAVSRPYPRTLSKNAHDLALGSSRCGPPRFSPPGSVISRVSALATSSRRGCMRICRANGSNGFTDGCEGRLERNDVASLRRRRRRSFCSRNVKLPGTRGRGTAARAAERRSSSVVFIRARHTSGAIYFVIFYSAPPHPLPPLPPRRQTRRNGSLQRDDFA